ncbi:hypothetical protein CDAR_288061 [Caerostris darwini]|uniref:ZP domain-containing protein n=1 Tax=Caerostris darwini TaxID=1538125 RepID=A0AAV4UEL5_9ARAC|nr:hypothetical protein CDAR_288061 [Caerostris darwini]
MESLVVVVTVKQKRVRKSSEEQFPLIRCFSTIPTTTLMRITIRAISQDYFHYFHLVLNGCQAKCLEPQCVNSSRNHNDSGRPFYSTSPTMPPMGNVLDILGNGWQRGQLKCSSPEKETARCPTVYPEQRRSLQKHAVGFNF